MSTLTAPAFQRGEDPIAYIKAYYSGENAVTQAYLKEHNEPLFNSIRGLCYRTGQKLRDYIPPKKKQRTAEEIKKSQESLRIQIEGVSYDCSKEPPSNEAINKIIYTLQSLKTKR